MLKWLDARAATQFGQELAQDLLSTLAGSMSARDAKFAVKAEKALIRADRRVREFKDRERLNFYKKAKLANAFLWTLKDSGCTEAYANELTDWLSVRL